MLFVLIWPGVKDTKLCSDLSPGIVHFKTVVWLSPEAWSKHQDLIDLILQIISLGCQCIESRGCTSGEAYQVKLIPVSLVQDFIYKGRDVVHSHFCETEKVIIATINFDFLIALASGTNCSSL